MLLLYKQELAQQPNFRDHMKQQCEFLHPPIMASRVVGVVGSVDRMEEPL